MTERRFKHEVTPEDRANGRTALVLVCMGSQSDWKSTMRATCEILDILQISFETRILSAHRTPDRLHDASEKAAEDSYQVIIAGAGGAAHLPGMFASKTMLPVIGVPVQSKALSGIDSLLSILQMPSSTPVATMAIGQPGAKNAALCAASILALSHPDIASRLHAYRMQLSADVPQTPVDD